MIIFLYFISRIIPLKWGYCLCGALGGITCNVMSGHRKTAMNNLEIAFGEGLSLPKRKEICRGMFGNMVKSLYEFLHFTRFSETDITSMVELDGSIIRKYTAGGRGVIVLTAHMGNWELLGARVVAEGFKLTVIGKNLRDVWLNRLMHRLRKSAGVENISKGKGIFNPVVEALQRNEIVGLLADQNAGSDGCFVDFFGKTASTFTGPAVFAAHTGAVILPAFCIRQKDNSHKVIFYDPIFPASPSNKETIYECAKEYTRCIERVVREYPEQWLWIHKRWKTQPDPENPEALVKCEERGERTCGEGSRNI